MSKRLGIGIIGANWTLLAHCPVWRLFAETEVVAICTSRRETAEAAAQAHSIPKAYWDYREMAADPDIHVLDVGTQPALRFDMVRCGLEQGKHVYNCLPFTVDLTQARELVRLQQARGVVGIVDAQFRHVPAVMKLKQMIEAGELGEIFHAAMHLQMPLIAEAGVQYPLAVHSPVTRPYPWLGDSRSGASALRNFGTHTLLNLSYLLGPIEAVIADARTFVKEWRLPDGSSARPDTVDTAAALVRFACGALANFNVSWATADAPGYYLEVCGSRGRAVIRDPFFCDAPTATLYFGDTRLRNHGGAVGCLVELSAELFEVPGTPFSKTNAPPFAIPMGWMFRRMLDAIRAGTEASPSFSEALHVHAAIIAAERSLQTGSWVRVDEAA
ncbi:MAG: Gfo/Idh/MocA family oxidoreductase [Steroidobacteraceae bacterium]